MEHISRTTPRERTVRIQALMALRSQDPQQLAKLLAARYVWHGACWLRRNAPNPGWWRNCIDGGYSRVRLGYTGEGVLALAFEYDPRFSDEFGYAQDHKVSRHFFGNYIPAREELRLGFGCWMDGYCLFMKRNPNVTFTTDMLDKAWSDLLLNPPPDWRARYRQPNSVERWLQKSGLLARAKKRGFLSRFFGSRTASAT
mgnify:FL=1